MLNRCNMASGNKKIFVHIGFGKTGTTTLQNIFFPKLCELISYLYWRNDSYVQSEVALHRTKMLLGFECKPLDLPDKTLISWEQLSGWEDPYYFEEFSQKNLIAFGELAHIILVIREPKSYLSSVYLQLCIHELNVQKPEHFFLEDSVYSERINLRKFAIDKFSYRKIIDFYRERFNKVTVVKFEHLFNNFTENKFIYELFPVNKKHLEILEEVFRKTTINKAFSRRGVNYTFSLSKLLYLFNLRFAGDCQDKHYIDIIRNNRVFKPKNYSLRSKIVNRILKELKWRSLIRKKVDKFLPYKKYTLDFDKLKYINIEDLDKEYEGLPAEAIYCKNSKEVINFHD